MSKLEKCSEFLETYSGRDKVMRLLCYSAQLVSGLNNSKRLDEFSEHLSECRTVLRLFDDLPMLNYTLMYGLGKKEPDRYMQICGIIVNIFDQFYYPAEHIAWAADKGLLSCQSDKWWLASSICWVLSLYFNLARSLRYLSMLHKHSQCVDISKPGVREKLHRLTRLQLNELLTALRCASDLFHAIHWLPEGILWAGKLKKWQIGALGTFSSVLSLIQSFAGLTVPSY